MEGGGSLFATARRAVRALLITAESKRDWQGELADVNTYYRQLVRGGLNRNVSERKQISRCEPSRE